MKIYSKGGILLAKVNEAPYSEAFMGERSISCTVKSPEPIQFLPGDYIDFRGERFVLDYTPTDKKNSSVGSIGDAFQYDLKFVSLKHELEKCLFLDVVLNDNDIHYTGLSDVQVFGDAKVLADRILANLNRLYTGEYQWKIEVLKESEAQNISLSDSNCWDAVALFKSLFNLNFTVYGREIKVGTAGKKIEHIFQYGSGDGLTEIVRTAVTGEAVVTRLKAYGGNRNLPRDYNKKGLVPESQYITNLMLPGYTETLIDYIDSDNISIYGVREAVFKDEEIYPSIYGMTAEELKAAGVSTSATGRLDEIVYVEPIQREDQATFNVWIKDIGFDIKKQLTPTTALISMRDGNLGGYEFEITNVVINSSHAGAKYKLTLNRNQDDNFILPDIKTYIKPGDHFVLLEIYMPEVYVKAAERRLLKRAQEYLAEYDHVKATYSISMDKVFMANHPTIGDTMYAGDLIRIVDEDLKLDREIIIQNLTIKTGGTVPEYEVTLSDNPVATTLDRVQDNITDIEQNITANKVDGVKEARRRAIELQLLKSNIFDPDGEIKDTFLQTMMLQVGANSMNYQMSKTTARPRLANMSFTNTSINLGADTVMHFAYGAGEEAASTWRIETPFSGSGLVEDKTYFVAIKASRDNLSAEWIVDENTYGVESIPGYYIFNFGILSAVTDGARLFSETRGNVYAYGDELSAGLISSIDRYCWFNLNTGDFQLYNKKTGAGLQFKDGVLTLGSFDPESGRFSSSISKIENEITQTSQQAADAQQAADEAARKAEDTQNYIDNTLREELDQLHDQADGLVERWDGDYIPSISNYPANQWTTEEEKQRHIDDTFTKNSGSEEYLGNSWKWSKVNGTWQWVLIADTALSAALLQSSEAKDIAKTKTRNFVATPYPPYEVGDLWTQGATGDMMRCATSRLSGSYVASDWTKASKYTDDAVAKEAIAKLAAMSDDGVISSEEKATLRNDKGQIDKEFAKYQQDAIQYGVSISSLQSAYTTLVNFLTNTVKINENTNFTFASGQQDTYNQNFANYYSARTSFANEVANKMTGKGKLFIRGTGMNNSANRIVYLNGEETNHVYHWSWRGLNLTTIKRSDLTVVEKILFDTYTSANAPAQALADKLNGLDSSVIVTLTSADAVSNNWTQPLTDAIERCGGSGTVPGYRVPYAFVGIPGIGKGNGIEVMTGNAPTDPYAEISTQIINGIPSGMSNASSVLAKEAQKAADAAKARLTAMSDDGVISKEEKATLRNDKKQIDEEYDQYTDQATEYSGVSMANITAAYDALTNFLTGTVKIEDDTDYTFGSGQKNTYNMLFADYYAARTAFANEIANEISARKSLGQSWSSGKMLYTDPTFKAGLNSIRAYNNLANGNVTFGLFPKVSESPVASDFNIRITTIGEASPGLGGFSFSNRSRANAVFVYRIIALIPKGYRIKFATNDIGTFNRTYWTTDTAGTGMWAEYIHVVECGQSGTFGTTGYFYLSALSSIVYPVDWYLAYASCFDLTEGSGPATDSLEAKKLAEEAKIAAENAEFLNSVFGKDNTIINGGVVLSSVMGVKNKRGVIVAGIINGELSQADNLMMFAGARSASTIGSAPFRVYADGSMYSSRGSIGGFTIGTTYIEKDGLRLSGGVISYSGSGYSMSFGGGVGGSLVYGLDVRYGLYNVHACASFQDNTNRIEICTNSHAIDAYGNIRIGVNSNYIRMENGKMYIDGIPPYKNSGESDSFVYLAMHTGTHRIAFIP